MSLKEECHPGCELCEVLNELEDEEVVEVTMSTWGKVWPHLVVWGLVVGAVVFYYFVGFWEAWF